MKKTTALFIFFLSIFVLLGRMVMCQTAAEVDKEPTGLGARLLYYVCTSAPVEQAFPTSNIFILVLITFSQKHVYFIFINAELKD